MRKKQGLLITFLIFLGMIINHSNLSYSKEFSNALIIVPEPNTACYNASYYFLATNISKDYDLPIVPFNCTDLTTLNPIYSFEKNTTTIYAFVDPSHLTPDLMFNIENYLRFGADINNFAIFWISSYNAEDAKLLFLRSKTKWTNNYWMGNFTYLYGETTKTYASKFTQYQGSSLNYTNVIKAFSDENTGIVYAHLKEKTPNEFLVYDDVVCPYGDQNIGIASSKGDIFLQNILLFLDNAYAGRVYGTLTNTQFSTFDFVNPNITKWNSTIPIAFSHIYNVTGPYDAGKIEISPVAYRYAGTDDFAKLFLYSLQKSNDVSFALKFAKNYYLLMAAKTLSNNAKSFDEFVALEYQAFGSNANPNFNGNSLTSYVVKRINTPISINLSEANESSPVTWNATVMVQTNYAINAIYNVSKNELNPSLANLWYFNGGNVNTTEQQIILSAVEAIYDYWIPDEKESGILNLQYNPNPRDVYFVNVTATGNNISVDAINHMEINTTVISSDSKVVYFASLFSVNRTLPAKYEVAYFNVTYQTPGIEIYHLDNKTEAENSFKIDYMVCNPASYSAYNLTVYVPLPNNTISCNAAYNGKDVNCSLIKNAKSGIVYGAVNIYMVAPSCEGLTLEYNTTGNGTLTTNHGEYNRGETISAFFNVTSDVPVRSNISVIVENSDNVPLFVNSSFKNITLTQKGFSSTVNFTIPLNATPGSYYVVVEAIGYYTGKPIFVKSQKILISDELKIAINITALVNDLYNYKVAWNYFNQTDSLKLTGNVENVRGEPIIGANVTAIIINKTQIAGGSVLSTNYGVFSLTLSWNNAAQNKYALLLEAKYNNNTGYENEVVYITSIPKQVFVSINATPSKTGKYLFSTDQEIIVKVHVLNSLNESAEFIPINITSVPSPASGSNSILKAETDAYGNAYLYIKPPLQVAQYKIYVTATNPLNKSVALNNETDNVYVLTLNVFNYDGKTSFIWKQTPDPAIKDENVYFKGNLSLKAPFTINKSEITGRSVTYKLIASGSDVTSYSSCSLNIGPSATSPEFEIVCKPHSTVTHCLHMDGYITYDGVTIHRKDVVYCFEVKENETTSSTSTTKTTTTTKTSNSLSKAYVKHCYTNKDCLATEYCDKNDYVCKPLSCPSGYVAFNHTCITPNAIYSLEVELPSEIKVVRGEKKTYTVEFKNTGHAEITHLSVSCRSKYINWKDWCSITGSFKNTIPVGKSIKLNITFYAPKSVKPDIYPFTLKITADHFSTEKSAALIVSPNKQDVTVLNAKLEEMNSKIKDLMNEIVSLSKKWNTTGVNIALSKLTQALTLLEDAKSNMQSGNYLQAEKELDQAQKLMSAVSQIYANENTSYHKHKRKILETSILIIVVVSGLGIFYYLWSLPSASPYSKNAFSKDLFKKSRSLSIFGALKGQSKTPSGGYVYHHSTYTTFQNLKRKIKELINKVKSKFKKERTTYTYKHKKRWFRI